MAAPPEFIDIPGPLDTPIHEFLIPGPEYLVRATGKLVDQAERARKVVRDAVSSRRAIMPRLSPELTEAFVFYKTVQLMQGIRWNVNDMGVAIQDGDWPDPPVMFWIAVRELARDILREMSDVWPDLTDYDNPDLMRIYISSVVDAVRQEHASAGRLDPSPEPVLGNDKLVERAFPKRRSGPASPLKDARDELRRQAPIGTVIEPVQRPAWRPSPAQLKRARTPSPEHTVVPRAALLPGRAKKFADKRPHPLSVTVVFTADDDGEEECGEAGTGAEGGQEDAGAVTETEADLATAPATLAAVALPTLDDMRPHAQTARPLRREPSTHEDRPVAAADMQVDEHAAYAQEAGPSAAGSSSVTAGSGSASPLVPLDALSYQPRSSKKRGRRGSAPRSAAKLAPRPEGATSPAPSRKKRKSKPPPKRSEPRLRIDVGKRAVNLEFRRMETVISAHVDRDVDGMNGSDYGEGKSAAKSTRGVSQTRGLLAVMLAKSGLDRAGIALLLDHDDDHGDRKIRGTGREELFELGQAIGPSPSACGPDRKSDDDPSFRASLADAALSGPPAPAENEPMDIDPALEPGVDAPHSGTDDPVGTCSAALVLALAHAALGADPDVAPAELAAFAAAPAAAAAASSPGHDPVGGPIMLAAELSPRPPPAALTPNAPHNLDSGVHFKDTNAAAADANAAAANADADAPSSLFDAAARLVPEPWERLDRPSPSTEPPYADAGHGRPECELYVAAEIACGVSGAT